MRILMLSWEYPPHIVGGLGAHVAALVPALVRAGIQVQVVTPRWAGGTEQEPVVKAEKEKRRRKSPKQSARGRRKQSGISWVHRVRPPVMSMGNFFADAQETNLDLEERAHFLFEDSGGFDLIHAHDWLVGFAATSLKRIHKTPLLATIHATERGRGRGNLKSETALSINGAEWWLTYEAWRVITASQFMANEVREYFTVPADKIDIVPNGVDVELFERYDPADLQVFRSHRADPQQPIVFSVGRLVQEKGAQLLTEAAPRVLAHKPDCRFVIAGTGPMLEHIRRRVWELGIGERVQVVGFISDEDRNRLLKVADAAVFPSIYEPFGIVALEAMAAKCPVVVSSVGGLAEVVRHGETGLTVFPDSVESLAWGVLQVLENPRAAKVRAERAYRMVKEEYSWDHIARCTIDIYERIVRERAGVKW